MFISRAKYDTGGIKIEPVFFPHLYMAVVVSFPHEEEVNNEIDNIIKVKLCKISVPLLHTLTSTYCSIFLSLN